MTSKRKPPRTPPRGPQRRRSPEGDHTVIASGKADHCILCGGPLAGTVLFNCEVLPFCRPHVQQLGPLLSKIHHAGSPAQHQKVADLQERLAVNGRRLMMIESKPRAATIEDLQRLRADVSEAFLSFAARAGVDMDPIDDD